MKTAALARAARLRVGTYNVYGWRGWPSERTPERMAASRAGSIAQFFAGALSELDCDVIALQECASTAAVTSIAALAGLQSHIFPSPLRWPSAVLSRFPLRGARSLAPVTADPSRTPLSRAAGVIYTETTGLGEIAMVVLHLHPNDHSVREAEAKELVPHIRATLERCAYVIVLGDFNSPPTELLHEELGASGFVNAMATAGGRLRPTRHPEPDKETCVDHIYVSERLAGALASARVFDGPPFARNGGGAQSWAYSDHYPVVAEFRLG